ncbi:hypothetical protein HID58_021932 [Brassica napus]|uniref:Serine-threonine/tyrosine-protein kinase catalytic domain-containing protein n=1 Tax=Brassica napus TaxID=3708 RepID=A0ABQ8CXU8_BRANA|nr:hypothetical protein HID58_021932 [Brassica napus]
MAVGCCTVTEKLWEKGFHQEDSVFRKAVGKTKKRVVKIGRVEDHAKWTTKTTNIVDEKVDMFAFGVLVLKVITSHRAVGNGCECVLFQDHTAPSYLNELICHGQFLME